GHRRAARRRERRQQPAQPGACHRAGDALPAPARLHRTGSCPCALRWQDHQERRQVAGTGTGEARLRLGQTGGSGVSAVSAKSTASPVERYKAAFEARWQGDDALTALRRAALEQFLSSGFPTQRDEAWKYTNLRRLESRSFTPAEGSALDAYQPEWLTAEGTRVVLVNGHCLPALSSQRAQPPGVTILTFKQWIAHEPAAVAAYLKEHEQLTGNVLEQLNL